MVITSLSDSLKERFLRFKPLLDSIRCPSFAFSNSLQNSSIIKKISVILEVEIIEIVFSYIFDFQHIKYKKLSLIFQIFYAFLYRTHVNKDFVSV